MTHLFGLGGLCAQAYGPSTWGPCTLDDTKNHRGHKARAGRDLGSQYHTQLLGPGEVGGRAWWGQLPSHHTFCLQVLLSLEHGVWAPNLHFQNPNPEIPGLLDGRLQVVDRPLPVRGGIVGINSFGFGGANVHVILQPNTQQAPAPAPHAALPHLLHASGRTAEAVQGLLEQGRQHSQDLAFVSMLNDIAATPTAAMPFRGYTVLGVEGDVQEVQQVSANKRPLWFICSGEPAPMFPGWPLKAEGGPFLGGKAGGGPCCGPDELSAQGWARSGAAWG